MTDARTEFLNGNLVLLGLSCALIGGRLYLLSPRRVKSKLQIRNGSQWLQANKDSVSGHNF